MKMGEYNQRQLDMRAREERSFKKEDELSAREKKILDDEKNISQRLKKIEADEVSISRRVEQINQDEIDARDILNNCLTVWNRLDNFQKGQFENMYPDETYQINRAMEILFNDDQNNDSASSMTL
jgi:uncharacterized protein (DUF3084 family)